MTAGSNARPTAVARRSKCLERLRSALAEMEDAGETINFHTVSQKSRVSRSWLYSDEEARVLVSRARGDTVGAAQSSGGDDGPSWRARAEMLREENLRLKRTIAQLRTRLANTLRDERERR